MSMVIKKILVFCAIQNIKLITAELFTSNAHLQNVLFKEREIANVLHDYVEREEERLEKIKKLAEEYKTHSNVAIETIDQYLGNPVNAFLLIKKLTIDWDREAIPILSNSSGNFMSQQLDQLKIGMPAVEDLTGAASALMRLQDTYQLDTATVAHGELAGIKSPILSAEDCFELGRLSYSEGDFYHTKLWMEQALNDYENKENQEMKGPNHTVVEEDSDLPRLTEERIQILDYLAYSNYKLGNLDKALYFTNALLRIAPHHDRAENNKKYFEALLADEKKTKNTIKKPKTPEYLLNRDSYRASAEFLTYEALCRGEDAVPLKNRNKLTCHYVSSNHPVLLLQPVKEEIVHHNPFVVIYHDVISDKEIEHIKHLATPKLKRATVHNTKTGQIETVNYRISKSAWLKSDEHQVVKTLTDRIATITGLDMSSAEDLQVANYGIGGQYEPHFDFARKEEENAFCMCGTGNRIGTFLIYMSDVEAGGATVFPLIGLKLYPKKGSAAFWYNLYRNGEGITNTRHAACPVLVGSKWIANKWIHERGQEFRRPCDLNAKI